MSKQKKLPEPEEVERLYWEEGMNQEEIADEFDCHDSTVSHYMRRHGIDVRDVGGRDKIPEEELLDEIIAGFVYLGVWPKEHDYIECAEFSTGTVRKRFGSWENAIEKAKERYEEEKDEWPEPGVIDRE